MEIDTGSLLLSLLVGSIGTVAFIYGKRQERIPHMGVGLVLIVYPYFVSNLFLMGGIAVVLCAGLWGAVKLGY